MQEFTRIISTSISSTNCFMLILENSEQGIKETKVSENQVSLQIYILTTMCLRM